MNYHDDGERGLGPYVASVSLGSDAIMSFRVKNKAKRGPQSRRESDSAQGEEADDEATASKWRSRVALKVRLSHGHILIMEVSPILRVEHVSVLTQSNRAPTCRSCLSTRSCPRACASVRLGRLLRPPEIANSNCFQPPLHVSSVLTTSFPRRPSHRCFLPTSRQAASPTRTLPRPSRRHRASYGPRPCTLCRKAPRSCRLPLRWTPRDLFSRKGRPSVWHSRLLRTSHRPEHSSRHIRHCVPTAQLPLRRDRRHGLPCDCSTLVYSRASRPVVLCRRLRPIAHP